MYVEVNIAHMCIFQHIGTKNFGGKDVQSNEAVVMEIMEPYFSKSYTLYTSNCFSLPVLLYYLSEHDFNSAKYAQKV